MPLRARVCTVYMGQPVTSVTRGAEPMKPKRDGDDLRSWPLYSPKDRPSGGTIHG
jgi:hypothetical protein